MAFWRPAEARAPVFPLTDVHRLAEARRGSISRALSDGCARLGIFNEDIWLVLEVLHQDDFHETVVAERRGHKLDVYYIAIGEHSVFLKISIITDEEEAEYLVVSSVRENERI